MTKYVVMIVVGLAGALALDACGGGSGPGSRCRTGCPCGRSCISCSDTCRMGFSPFTIDDDAGVDDAGDDR